MNSLMDASFKIAERGLVSLDDFEKDQLLIARPSSLSGTVFRFAEKEQVIGLGDVAIKVNAPTAKIVQLGDNQWLLDISSVAAPGPGPIWFRESFSKLEDAIQALFDCYFSDRVDFNNESLVNFFSRGKKSIT